MAALLPDAYDSIAVSVTGVWHGGLPALEYHGDRTLADASA